jgi:Fe-S oxidoreductase
MMSPVSELGAAGYVIFWFITLLAFGIFGYRTFQLLRYLSLGKGGLTIGQVTRRTLTAIGHFFGQWCQFKNLSRKDLATIGHVFMAWGFFCFVVYYILFIIIGSGFGIGEAIENNAFYVYYSWVMDIAAPFIIVGAAWGIIRRYIVRPPRLKGQQTFEAGLILVTVLIHPFTHLFKIATGIALGDPPSGLGIALPPISAWLSGLFTGGEASALAWHTFFFWAHWGFVLFVAGIIGYTRYLHVAVAPFNVFLRSADPKGALTPIDLEKAETFGVAKITDFTRKQLLDLYACVICGRCQDACPAQNSGKALNPKDVIQDLKKHLLAVAPGLLKGDEATTPVAGEVIPADVIWDCVTCRACMQVCPMSIEHVPKLMDMRRNLAMEKSQFPEAAQEALKSLSDRGHPYRGTTSTRTTWTEGLEVKALAESTEIDILYWVGCSAALDDRNIKVARAMAKIMKTAGVKFGILGDEEFCCGDPARRMGDEYQFQLLCQQNIEILKGYNVKKVVASCPHCFNSLKHEYPQFGGNFEVIHHTQIIAELLRAGRLKLSSAGKQKWAYHDSCYLGRYNDIYEEPRRILKALVGRPVELPRRRSNSFCCGGGGGHMWMEEEPEKRVNNLRVDEVIGAGVDGVATACPYCLSMLDDGIKTRGVEETLQVKDISELVAAALG